MKKDNLSITIPKGNNVITFVANKEVVTKYYKISNKHKIDSWFDPRYSFFGEFYQKGDKSLNGYVSGKSQNQAQRTAEEVEGIIKLLNLRQGASIVDCPCGIGRHSIKLAEKGYRVLAVDLNYEQLIVGYNESIANEKIILQGYKRIFFCLDDMKNIGTYPKQKNCFDAVINMFYSFGFFENEMDNLKVLRNMYDLLIPGGKFLMHTDVNVERIISGTYAFNEERTLEDGSTLCIQDSYDCKNKRIVGSWSIDGVKKDYSVRVYDTNEWVDLCKKVGFKNVKIYSDWSGEYSNDSEILIFVAEK